jgi:macrolide transport system ATP-binding/permease protein
MRLLSGMISKEMMIGMPYLRGLGLNAHVLLFAGLLASIAAMLFSLTPMLNLSLPK